MKWVEQGAGVAWGALMDSAHLSSCLLAAVVRCPLQRGRSSLRGVVPVWLAPSHPCPGQARRTHGHPLPPAPPGSWYLACREGRRGPHVYVRTYLHLLALQCLLASTRGIKERKCLRVLPLLPPLPSPPLPSSQWYLQPKQQLHTDRLGRLGQLAGVAGKAKDPNVLDGRGTIRGRGNAYRGCAELTNNTKGSCDQSGSH